MTKQREHNCDECFIQPICKIDAKIKVTIAELAEEFKFKNIPINRPGGPFLHRQITFKLAPLHLCSWFRSYDEQKKLAEEYL